MMTARKLAKVGLETALKVVPHFPIWLVPKNEVDSFKRWVEGLHLTTHQPAHGSPEVQPAAPDVDTLGDDSIFDDDSVGDELMSGAHSRGYKEDGGQLIHNDPVAQLRRQSQLAMDHPVLQQVALDRVAEESHLRRRSLGLQKCNAVRSLL